MRRSDELLDDWQDRSGMRRRYGAGDALGDIAGTFGEQLKERPGTFAGIVTFIALFAFVGANALWHQPYSHTNAFYSTRDHAGAQPMAAVSEKAVRTGKIPAAKTSGEMQTVTRPVADPTVLGVQATLRDLRLYEGEVDGLMGTRTRQAIQAYQTILRMPATGEINEQLLAQLRSTPHGDAAGTEIAGAESDGTLDENGIVPALPEGDVVASIVPTPRPQLDAEIGMIAPQPEARPEGSDEIRRLQAGLRQFGNADLEIDGRMGAKTRQAIAEFQEIFRLNVTGEADAALFKEMRRQGFIN